MSGKKVSEKREEFDNLMSRHHRDAFNLWLNQYDEIELLKSQLKERDDILGELVNLESKYDYPEWYKKHKTTLDKIRGNTNEQR